MREAHVLCAKNFRLKFYGPFWRAWHAHSKQLSPGPFPGQLSDEIVFSIGPFHLEDHIQVSPIKFMFFCWDGRIFYQVVFVSLLFCF